MKANFLLPGFYEHFVLNLNFIDYMLEYPERFYDNVGIDAVYGNFQYCIFEGGRIFDNYKQSSQEEIEFITSAFNNRNIPIRLVFTNNQLKEKHFSDRFCNKVLEICNASGMNEITIADQRLEDYIRNKYNNFKFISSTTKCLSDIKMSKEELNKDYHLVCLDYNLNKNMEYLDSLSQQEKEKCELLVNAICAPNCPSRKEHYKMNGLYSLNYRKPYQISECLITESTVHPVCLNSTNNLTPEEIYTIYLKKGFSHFKLEGRSLSDMEVLLNYIRYMIKPEWQFETINNLTHMVNTSYKGIGLNC